MGIKYLKTAFANTSDRSPGLKGAFYWTKIDCLAWSCASFALDETRSKIQIMQIGVPFPLILWLVLFDLRNAAQVQNRSWNKLNQKKCGWFHFLLLWSPLPLPPALKKIKEQKGKYWGKNQIPHAFILISGSLRAFSILNYCTESSNIFMYLKNIFCISKGIFW